MSAVFDDVSPTFLGSTTMEPSVDPDAPDTSECHSVGSWEMRLVSISGEVDEHHPQCCGQGVRIDPTHSAIGQEPTCAPLNWPAKEDGPVVIVPWSPRLDVPVSVCSRSFYETNLVDYNTKMIDGFFDPGRSWSSLPSVEYVMRHPELASRCRETIVVDAVTDAPLKRFVERCSTILASSTNLKAKVHMLATLVSNFQGGWNTDLLPRSDKFVQRMRAQFGFNVVPIGQVQHGVCRHRAVLFKYLCDNFDIPCRLIRGNYHHVSGDKEGHSWNVVLINGNHYLCDVMHDPGMLYDVDCKKTIFYHRDMKIAGRVHVAGPGLNSLPVPPDTHVPAVQVNSQDEATKAASQEVMGSVEEVQKECARLFAVHQANTELMKCIEDYKTEIQIKDKQIEQMARMLVKVMPNTEWL